MTQMELPFDSGPIKFTQVNAAQHLSLDAMSELMHVTAKLKGFWPPKYYEAHQDRPYGEKPVTEEAICTKLALVHSEVTEILEAIRKEQGEYKVVEEMADVIIRLLDLYAALKDTGQVDSSLDDVVQSKMRINEQRPKLHGNKF